VSQSSAVFGCSSSETSTNHVSENAGASDTQPRASIRRIPQGSRGGTVRYAITIAVLLSVPLLAQNPVEERFEVVSIKPHTGGPTTSVPPPSPGALRRPNVTVQALVLFAYGIESYQVIDMPAWGRTDRFDVEARAAGATLAVMPAMTRSLLRDRFGLRTHQETREGTTYSLGLSQTNGQLGPGIRRNSDECKSTIAPPRSVPAGAITATGCGSVDQIARFAARMLGAPVTDKTRLSACGSTRSSTLPMERLSGL
jgi:uncharacterized protein (TIGR03435 family)